MESMHTELFSLAAPMVLPGSDCVTSSLSENFNQSHETDLSKTKRMIIDDLIYRTANVQLHPMDISVYHEHTTLDEPSDEPITNGTESSRDLKHVIAHSEEAACGHPTLFSDITIEQPVTVFSTCGPYNDEIYNKRLTPDGYDITDDCFCENRSLTCHDCRVAQLLRLPHEEWHYRFITDDFDESFQYYLDPKLFAVEVFQYDVDSSDYEGYYEQEQLNLLCIKYIGNNRQRRTWHVVTSDNEPFYRRMKISTGIFIPELTSRLERYGVTQIVPESNFQLLDIDETNEPQRLTTLALASAIKNKTWTKDDATIIEFATRSHAHDGTRVLPYVNDIMVTHNNLKLPQLVTAQGDDDTAAGELSITQDTHENTTLAESTEASNAYVAREEFRLLPWITDKPHTYPDLTERWTKAFQFQWTTSQTQGLITNRFDLPIEAIQNFQNAPNALPWRQHAYYRSDIEVKVQVNSQPGQSGYLGIGTMYEASEATAIGNRVVHAANIIQMPHMRISAGASNSGDMIIPFVRYFPVGCVLDNNFDVPQYFCTLFVSPFLQLRTGADGPQVVDVTIMLRFPNCVFYGQRTTEQIVTAQGWEPDLTQCGDVESNPGPFLSGLLGTVSSIAKVVSGAGSSIGTVASGVSGVANGIGSIGSAAGKVIGGVESLLRPLFPKKDMDRPQNILEPVNLYLQQNTSLSLATGTNNVKLLQLQAESSISHPPGFVPEDDQFNNRFITSVFGLSDYFQWSTTSAAGTLLYTYEVTPLKAFQSSSGSSTIFPTPMGALAGQYGGFHGDIEMRLTFAVSKFHSGRVFIVYSPDVIPTYANIGSYYSVLLDVQDQSVYTFTIPYQVPSPYAPHFFIPQGFQGTFITRPVEPSTRTALAYGYVSIFVENQLRVMQTATPVIDVMVELRGADNFHLVLPVGGNYTSIPTVTAMGMDDDERSNPHTTQPTPQAVMPMWAAQLNESFDCRDVVKRYVDWFDIVSPAISTGRTLQSNFINVTVCHMPVVPFLAIPIQNVTFTEVDYAFTFLNKSMVIARERINLETNNTISIRVPWTNYASMLSNSINPTSGRLNTMAPYCNGRIIVVIEYLPSFTTSTGIFNVMWDVTAGSASTRDQFYNPDMLTLLHDGFRFCKGDFNYQIDITPTPSGANTALRMRCYRAFGDGGNLYVFQGFPQMIGLYPPRQAIAGATPTRGGLERQNAIKGGKRDLTEDGDIESNPGPTQSKPTGQSPLPDDNLTQEEKEELGGGGIRISLLERIAEYCKLVLGWTSEQILEFVRGARRISKYAGAFPGISKISELITTLKELRAVSSCIDRVSAAVENLTAQIQQTREKVESFSGKVTASLADLDAGSLVSNGIEYVCYIVNIYNSRSIGMTILNTAALLSKMGLGRYVVNELVDKLGTFAQGDDTEGLEREYTSLIVTGVLGALGLGTMNFEKEGFMKPFLSGVKDFFRNGFAVKKFLDSHFRCINDICSWVKMKVFGKVDKGGLTEDLLVWCERVHVLAEVHNYDTILNDPIFADTLMSLQDEAFEFDRLFIASRIRPPNQYSIYRSKLQKAIDLLGQQGTMQKSRPVPFCLWVYGNSGCGKSHVCDNILTEIGMALGVDSANPIYTRSPDVEFWNGYTGQKLISWQDFAKVTTGETYRKQVAELSSLIEPTPFNPPFAALEDKRKIADAWAVYVSSNKAFPDVQSIGMIDSVLFYRRRHALVKMRLNPAIVEEYKGKGISLQEQYAGQTVYYANNIPSEDLASRGPYFHVQFGFHASGISVAEPEEWLDYDDFTIEVKRRAVLHREREVNACIQRRGIYSKLRQTTPTGVEFREEVKTLREEIERLQRPESATAQGKDKAVKNLLTTMDYEQRDQFEQTNGLGDTSIDYIVVQSKDCTHSMEIQQRPTTSEDTRVTFYVEVCEECDPKILQRDKVKQFASGRVPGVAVDSAFGPITIENQDEPTLPRAGRQYTPLDYARQATTGLVRFIQGKGLPSGYAYWSEVVPTCCHNKDILDKAYFEVVAGNIELVLDMESIPLHYGAPFPLFSKYELLDYRRYNAFAGMGFKLILPTVCEQSKFDWVNCVEFHFTGQKVGMASHQIGSRANWWNLESLKRPWTCNTLTKPNVSYFKIEKDLIRFLVSGTYIKLEGADNMVTGLNHLMSLHSRDSVAFCNSFFYWRSGGKLRTAKLYPFANAMLKDVSFVFKTICVGLFAVLLAYKVYRLIRNSAECVEAQARDYDQKTEASNIPKVNFVQSAPVVVTAKGDEELGIVHNSLCLLRKGTMRMLGVRLCSNFVLAPQHLAWVPGEFGVTLLHNGVWSTEMTFEPTTVKYAGVKNYDYAVYRFVSIPAGRNIVNYFATRAQGATLRTESTVLTLAGTSLQVRPVRVFQYHGPLAYENEKFQGARTNMVGWQYWLGTESVRCGSLIMSNGLLCGMHVAQNLKTGDAFAVGICKQMLVDALGSLGATPFDMKMNRTTPQTTTGEPKMQPPENAVVIPIGKAVDPVRYSGKSNLEKSIVHGELSEPFRFPAAQAATAQGEQIGYDIVMKGCEKQFKPPKPIDPEEVEMIGDYLIERIVAKSKPIVPTDAEPLTLGQAIAGIDGVPLMCSMKLNTSIGWPLCASYPKGMKKANIIKVDKENETISIDEKAYNDYETANELRKNATLPPTTFMDFPKDELLKPGKDTRLINGAPLHHTLDMRRYLMEFFAAITTLTNKIAVGIDVHSGEWALVHAGCDDVVDEDYSGFGPGFHSQWMDVVRRLAVAWCRHHKKVDEEYENVVNCLITELQNANHVAGDLVYQVFCGSPSGAFATDRINSIANLCYHCLCYKRKHGTFTGFWNHYTLVYGDDTRRRETAYTGDEFQECMASLGIVVNRDKSGVTSFLKRQFVPLEYNNVGVMLAPLPKPIVGDILNWVRRPYVSKLAAFEETVGSYLSEIFHHGRDEFNNSRSKIKDILAKHGSYIELVTFDDLFRQKYLSNGLWPVVTTGECAGRQPAAESS